MVYLTFQKFFSTPFPDWYLSIMRSCTSRFVKIATRSDPIRWDLPWLNFSPPKNGNFSQESSGFNIHRSTSFLKSYKVSNWRLTFSNKQKWQIGQKDRQMCAKASQSMRCCFKSFLSTKKRKQNHFIKPQCPLLLVFKKKHLRNLLSQTC